MRSSSCRCMRERNVAVDHRGPASAQLEPSLPQIVSVASARVLASTAMIVRAYRCFLFICLADGRYM